LGTAAILDSPPPLFVAAAAATAGLRVDPHGGAALATRYCFPIPHHHRSCLPPFVACARRFPDLFRFLVRSGVRGGLVGAQVAFTSRWLVTSYFAQFHPLKSTSPDPCFFTKYCEIDHNVLSLLTEIEQEDILQLYVSTWNISFICT
jgi:hypothetical protein